MKQPLIFLLPAVLVIGCAKPYVKVSPDYSATPTMPAILAGAAVSFDEIDDETSLGTAIMDTVMNAHLPEFGEMMMERMTPFLAENGFELTTDHSRVSKGKKENLETVSRITSIVVGAWVDPEGSMIVVNNNTLFSNASYNIILRRAAPIQDNEHFVFIDARVSKRTKWFVVGYSQMVLDINVIDGDGNEVYVARGVGDGPKAAFVALHHVEALTEALEMALDTIEAEVPKVMSRGS
jgi:hypothetical protein